MLTTIVSTYILQPYPFTIIYQTAYSLYSRTKVQYSAQSFKYKADSRGLDKNHTVNYTVKQHTVRLVIPILVYNIKLTTDVGTYIIQSVPIEGQQANLARCQGSFF